MRSKILKKTTVALAITGSFCTFDRILQEIKVLVNKGYDVVPIFSFNVASLDTRFFKAKDFREEVIKLTGKVPIDSLQTAEPLGPSGIVDVMVVAPCTGNTMAKLANAVTDTPVTMAVKAHLRNNKPVVLAISTNDALGLNAKNLGVLLSAKNIYFVPFSQDNPHSKPTSIIADYSLIGATIESALQGKQIQPVLKTN